MTKQCKSDIFAFFVCLYKAQKWLVLRFVFGCIRCIPDTKTALKALKWLVRYPHFAPETPMKPIFFTPKIFKEDL